MSLMMSGCTFVSHYIHDFVMYSHPAAGTAMGRIETLYVHVSLNLCVAIHNPIAVIQGLDECQYAKVTPLFNPWQYASIMKCSLPLYTVGAGF